MNTRFHRKLVGILGIVAVVFAQLAVAAYACPLMLAEPDVSVRADSVPLDPVQPALCEKHCQDGQQTLGGFDAPMAFVALAPAFVVVLSPQSLFDSPAVQAMPSLQRATDPPLAVRHCSFRI